MTYTRAFPIIYSPASMFEYNLNDVLLQIITIALFVMFRKSILKKDFAYSIHIHSTYQIY